MPSTDTNARLFHRLRRRLLRRSSRRGASPLRPRGRTETVRCVCVALIGWALTRETLLFSVNPLAAAAVLACPAPLLPAVLLGVLIGLWQGASGRGVLLLTLAVGLCVRAGLRWSGAQKAAARRELRRRLVGWLKAHLCAGATEEAELPRGETVLPPLSVTSRLCSAAVGAVVGAFAHGMAGGFAAYDVFGACVLLLLIPLACVLFCFGADAALGLRVRTWRAVVGYAALVMAVCFGLRRVTFFMISPAVAGLLALSLAVCRRRGWLPALGCTAVGVVALDALALPPLAICVLLFAAAQRLAGRWTPLVCVTGGLLAALAGGEQLLLRLAPSMICGVLLESSLSSLQRYSAAHGSEAQEDYRHDATRAALLGERRRCERLTARLCSMASALGGLGELLSHPTEATGVTESEAIAESYAAMSALLRDAAAEDGVTLSPDDGRAVRLGQALKAAGAHFDHVCVLAGEGRCRVEVLGCSAAHIGISAGQLQQLAEQITGELLRPPQFECGGEEGGSCVMRPRPQLSVSCHTRSVAAGQSIGTRETGALRRGENKKVPGCGDSVRCFFDGQEHFFALLCDGMGTGEAAALTSASSVLHLERLLRAGVGMDTALTLLNRYLRSRRGAMAEVSSTVDLFSLDVFSGRARWVKSGAADTLILRGEQLYCVSSRTFPLGILSGVDMQVIPFDPQRGDVIVMMSDGILDALPRRSDRTVVSAGEGAVGGEECEMGEDWLTELLRAAPNPLDERAACALSEQILHAARAHGSEDDMTIAILRIA